jgi:hypothetical protein
MPSKLLMRILRERQRSIVILVWGKRTPDMPKDLGGSLGQRLKMGPHVREQQLKRAAVMMMRHDPSRDGARARECRLASGS